MFPDCMLLALAVASVAPFSSGACPEGSIQICDGTFVYSSAATHEAGGCESGAGYDLIAGTAGASAAWYVQAFPVDRFQVVGIPDDGPIRFRARLHVEGHTFSRFPELGTRGCISFGMAEGAASEVNVGGCGGGYDPYFVSTDLFLDIERRPFEPFEMRFRVGASGGGDAFGSGQMAWSFVDLPPGASIISCYGYRQDPPVPVVGATWGRLKSTYR